MGIARLHGCAVLRESLMYYSEVTEGVARLRGCADVQLFGRIYCAIVN